MTKLSLIYNIVTIKFFQKQFIRNAKILIFSRMRRKTDKGLPKEKRNRDRAYLKNMATKTNNLKHIN